MPKITFDQLRQAPPLAKRKTMTIEEWGGGSFTIIQMSGLQHEQIMERLKKEFGEDWQKSGGIRPMVSILCICLVDEDGQSPSEEFLLGQPLILINRLSNDVLELNGMLQADEKQLEKN